MSIKTFGLLLLILGLYVNLLPTAEAAVPQTYTNDNLWSTTHDRPVSFSVQPDGSITGQTESGKTFSQVTIPNEFGIRIQKFSIDEAWFYVTGYDIILADTDAEAARIAWQQQRELAMHQHDR